MSRLKIYSDSSILDVIQKNLDAMPKGRGGNIWARKELREGLKRVLAIPGIRADIALGTFDELLSHRTPDVRTRSCSQLIVLAHCGIMVAHGRGMGVCVE